MDFVLHINVSQQLMNNVDIFVLYNEPFRHCKQLDYTSMNENTCDEDKYILEIVVHNNEVTRMNGHVFPKMDMNHSSKILYHEHYVDDRRVIVLLVDVVNLLHELLQ